MYLLLVFIFWEGVWILVLILFGWGCGVGWVVVWVGFLFVEVMWCKEWFGVVYGCFFEDFWCF